MTGCHRHLAPGEDPKVLVVLEIPAPSVPAAVARLPEQLHAFVVSTEKMVPMPEIALPGFGSDQISSLLAQHKQVADAQIEAARAQREAAERPDPHAPGGSMYYK